MKISDEVRAKRDQYRKEAETILDKLATGNGSDDDIARVEAIVDDGGILDQFNAAHDDAVDAEKRSERRAKLASIANGQTKVQGSNIVKFDDNGQAALPNVLRPKLNYLKAADHNKEAENCFLAVNWIQAALFNNGHAKQNLRSRFGNDWMAAHVEGTGSKGGYLVPEQMYNGVLMAMEEVGITRQLCNTLPMVTDEMTVPRRDAGLTVYSPGEGNAYTESEATLSQLRLTTKTRGVLAKVSRELQGDAAVSVVDWLLGEIGHAIALQQDDELINGDGTSPYFGVSGIINELGTAGVHDCLLGDDTFNETELSDVLAMMALLPEKYRIRNQLSFVCSYDFYVSALSRMALTANGAASVTFSDGTSMDRWMGYPLYVSDRMPAEAASTVALLFGNFRYACLLGDRVGIEMDTTQDRYFETNEIGIRGLTRYDINVHALGDSSDAGAIVALKTAS